MESEIFVIGHKNPDTDSICSAIAYAELKRQMTGKNYIAMRAGNINPETGFVLERFAVPAPTFIEDVRIQVKDIEFRKVAGVSGSISLKEAWASMRENSDVTLPIVNRKNQLEGLITIGDIAMSYMDVYDSNIIATAKTSYQNIVKTLEGEIISGDTDALYTEGKVLISAANPDIMENYIEDGDLVILGNRYESQLSAIEMNAKCIIVCDGAPVQKSIIKRAEENNCTIISTEYDTFTVARLMNQSMPIRFFMSKKDLITFTTEDYIDDIRNIMAQKRHRHFPILDNEGYYVGMMSRRNLLDAKKKKVILVDHNEKSQAVEGIEDAEILEIIDHHRIGSLETISPVYFRNQPLGCTATIIYQMYLENGFEVQPSIAGLLCSAILSDTLVYKSPTCTELDRQSAEALAKIANIDVTKYSREMFSAGSNLSSKTPEEIFYQDFKRFNYGDLTFGVGQINIMDQNEVENIKAKLIPYMEKAIQDHGVDMLFFMLTDILESSSELLYQGHGAKELVIDAFKLEDAEEKLYLQGVVSRKKQLIPSLMKTLQENN